MKHITLSRGMPSQMVNYPRKRNDKLSKKTMDFLEFEASKQRKNNNRFNDYYAMYEGTLVSSDYMDEDLDTLPEVGLKIQEITNTDRRIKHYDIIGTAVNQIVGEWIATKDDFIVDCLDSYTDNEFLRERTRQIQEYSQKKFAIELEQELIRLGITPQNFETEEEMQAYEQQVQQVANSIKSPEQIERDMKTWKTQAVEWSNNTLTQNTLRHKMEGFYRDEMKDYLLTGRWFRNYRVGFDYYRPERWDVREVFFSQDADAKFPQRGEFCGRQRITPVYKIKELYGHFLSAKAQRDLDEIFETTRSDSKINLNTTKTLHKTLFGVQEQLPFYNYRDFQEAKEIQDLYGEPMGRDVYTDENGNETETPYFIPDSNYLGNHYHNRLPRTDIDVRKDGLLVTECYYRSYKKMWFVCYKASNGVDTVEIVTDEILPEFIKQNNIKKVEHKSIQEFKDNMKVGEMYSWYQPEVRLGLKINTGIGESIYEDDVLEFQVRGDSDYFDVLLPVGGIIDSNFLSNKMRPYQIAFNVTLNQAMSLMEKELGLFWLFDVNLLTSEYKDSGDAEEQLLRLTDFARDVGLAPIDLSKSNTQNASPQGNAFTPIDMSMGNQIMSKMNQAEVFKNMALSQVGMNPQRMGTPSQYETAEGIRQSTQASYAQTEDIYSNMGESHLMAMEIELAVAQYAQKEYKDADLVFTLSDGNKSFMHLNDPDFPLRRMGVIPMNDAKNKRLRETLVQTLMQMNTFGGNAFDYAELFTSKTVQEIRERAFNAQERLRAQEEQRIAQEQENNEANRQTQLAIAEADRLRQDTKDELDRENRLEVAKINALGRASDKDSSKEDMDRIVKETNLSIKDKELESRINRSQTELEFKKEAENKRSEREDRKLDIKAKEMNLRDKISEDNKFIAQINKN